MPATTQPAMLPADRTRSGAPVTGIRAGVPALPALSQSPGARLAAGDWPATAALVPLLDVPVAYRVWVAAAFLLGAITRDTLADPVAAKRAVAHYTGEAHHLEALTNGETRVLRYLPTNLSAREIAEELYLSVNTVKTHQRHLYQKLGARSRTQAVEQARALGLLAPSARRPNSNQNCRLLAAAPVLLLGHRDGLLSNSGAGEDRSMSEIAPEPQVAVAAALRAAIIRGDYAPRQRLVESELCEDFNTSRFIVRNALQELSADGLVEFQRNRGARVREISLTEAIEITQVRRLLEGFEAAQAARRVTNEQKRTLRAVVKNMRAAVAAADPLRYSDLNAQLHAMIQEIADNKTCARVLRQLRDQTIRHSFSLSLVPGRASVSLPQHEAIVAALIAQDPQAAEQAMLRHLDSVLEAFQTLSGRR
jgi:DNA-binding GntR family transcriptional regulator/DNA-binding CsgD family transcriptional regulator